MMETKTYNDLKRLAKKNQGGYEELKVALLGDCATQHLRTAIEGMAVEKGLDICIWEAEYNQIYAQVMDENSELYEFAPKVVILYPTSEKLLEQYYDLTSDEKRVFAQKTVQQLENYWTRLSRIKGIKIIQYQFVEIDDKVYGNYAAKAETSFLYMIRKLQCLLQERVAAYKNVYIMDLNSIQSVWGRAQLFNEKLYYLAKMPISLDLLPIVAERTVSLLAVFGGRIIKCVICDLDNTLWGGTIAEDGVGGIQIGELGLGRAYTDLQKWLKVLKQRGILLAVCSKNDEITARTAFEQNSDMELRYEDFAVFVANYEDKAANIKYIQSVLNIGFDSMVFLDDNPFERNLVRTLIPEIIVPELPEDPAMYLTYLQELNLFETISNSQEDEERTRQYQEEAKRHEMLAEFSTYQEYLENLGMQAKAAPFDKMHTPRIAQLTQRSNQFNLRTIRYTEKEIEELIDNNEYLTCFFELEDKFGSHGLISVVILKKLSDKELFIDTWLMSCRVLKRGVEEFVMNKIVSLARQNHFELVRGEYLPTKKNAMVKELLPQMGFQQKQENAYFLIVDQYQNKRTEIKEKEDE